MTLSPAERRLVLACVARPGVIPDDDVVELSCAEMDWNAIFTSTLWHKVAFLVYARLRGTGALDAALARGNLPLLLLNHWKQLYRVNARRSELYQAVARDVTRAAAARVVDLAVSKGGIPLLGWAYTCAERKMYDLDLIGQRAEIRGIEAVLADCGFAYGEYSHAREEVLPSRPGDLRKHLLQGRGLPNFVRAVEDQVIDYQVVQVRFRIGAGSKAGRSLPAGPLLADAEVHEHVRMVNRVDLALQLALHIHREAHEPEYVAWNLDWGLIKLCDFDRVLHGSDPAGFGARLLQRAGGLGFLDELRFACLVTGAVLPSPALAALAAIDDARSAEGLDRLDQIREAIWSVGSARTKQDGAWTTIVGAKTT